MIVHQEVRNDLIIKTARVGDHHEDNFFFILFFIFFILLILGNLGLYLNLPTKILQYSLCMIYLTVDILR